MELDKIKSAVVEEFQNRPGVIAVLLYGSYAKGLAKLSSDVDIAVLYAAPLHVPAFSELWDIKDNLEEALGCSVDLICLNNAGPIISSQVYKYHKPLLIKDKQELERYFMQLIVNYTELKEFRRDMEEHILERRFYDRP